MIAIWFQVQMAAFEVNSHLPFHYYFSQYFLNNYYCNKVLKKILH